MKNRSSVTPMLMTRRWANGTIEQFMNTGATSSLTSSSVINGDFVTPNNQSYDKKTARAFNGSRKVYSSNGSLLYSDSGCIDTLTLLSGLPNGQWLEPPFGDFESLAKSRFYKNLRDSELNLSESIGEAGQTKRMLEDATKKVTALARRARRKAIRKAVRYGPRTPWLAALAEAWLSYKYGWSPLLKDIFGLVDLQRTRCNRIIVQGTAKGGRTTNTVSRPIGAAGPLVQTHVTQEVRSKFWALAIPSNRWLLDYSRITSMNPVNLIWQFSFLSFVVDWFTGLGDYLEQLEQSCGIGLDFIRGYQTNVSRDVYRATVPSQRHGTSSFTIIEKPWLARGVHVTKIRRRLTSFPPATLPELKIDLGASRLISAAALIKVLLVPPRVWGGYGLPPIFNKA